MLLGWFRPPWHRDIVMGRPVMAAARDQAARIVRTGPETAEGEAARDNSAHLAEQIRTHVAEETRRLPAEPPVSPATEKPAAPPASAHPQPEPRAGTRNSTMIAVLP